VDTSVLNSQAAQAHNQQFTNYTGDKIAYQQVKTLMNNIVSNNVTGKTADTPQQVYVKYAAVGAEKAGWMDPSKVAQAVRAGYTYKVEIENQQAINIDNVGELGTVEPADEKEACYYSNGYIRIITITENPRQKSN
jgi:hypothetical protein